MSNYTKSTNFATKDNLTPGDPLKIVRGTEIDTEFNNIATAIATKTDNSAAAITGGSITGITDLAIADGGTGASTATAAINNLLPSQTSNANKYLQTDGTNVSWDAVSLSTADITGTLPVANGGTGVTSSTGTGSVVLSNSPTLVTPALGTPASGVATNLTGLPISTGVSGLGTGVATFLGTPSSANLASAITDETGSGALVFANSPTLVTPALGTPSSATLTNATGLPISTGVSGLGTGVATFLATPSSANLASAVSDETGSGALVFANSPTLVTPALGTPSAATLTNATGLPISTGVSGLGTGVATALAVNVGSAGAPVVNGGALGTPSSGTATNLTGLPLSTGVTGTLPTANGGTNLTSFTSGGVVYASSTSALATGSALTYNGSTFKVAGTDAAIIAGFGGTTKGVRIETTATGTSIGGVDSAFVNSFEPLDINGSYTTYSTSGTERMRLTSTGLGIGTSSPSTKLEVSSGAAQFNGGGIDGTFGDAILFGNSSFPTVQKNRIRSSISAGAESNLLSIETSTATAGTYNSNQLVLRGDGNVGIGTSSPSEKLTVNGNIKLGTSGTSWIYGPATTGRSIYSNSDSTAYIVAYGSSYGSSVDSVLQFTSGTSNTAILNANGAFSLAGATRTANGVGITFPATQSASSDANTLDDYEEGTWTFAVATTGGSVTMSSDLDACYYIKIGRLVTVGGQVTVSSVSSPTGAIVVSLPFAGPDLTETAEYPSGSIYIGNSVSKNANDFALLKQDGSEMRIYIADVSLLSSANANAQQLQAGTVISFQLSYYASA